MERDEKESTRTHGLMIRAAPVAVCERVQAGSGEGGVSCPSPVLWQAEQKGDRSQGCAASGSVAYGIMEPFTPGYYHPFNPDQSALVPVGGSTP